MIMMLFQSVVCVWDVTCRAVCEKEHAKREKNEHVCVCVCVQVVRNCAQQFISCGACMIDHDSLRWWRWWYRERRLSK